MAIRAILILGSIMLGCGSIGLLLVRMTSPLLRGLGYLGGAFAAGSLGAGMLLESQHVPVYLGVVLADICVLGSLVLLQVTILEMLESESLAPVFGYCLLGVQAIFDIFLIATHGNDRARAAVAGLLIGAQACQTITTLLSRSKGRLRVPGAFVAVLLVFFALVNVSRSLAICFGYFPDHRSFHAVAAGTFAIFIAIALGLGFGVFWMATTALTSGLEQMASTDPLTRTYNRRVFLRWCERERERNGRQGTPFSLLMVDFDHFKQVNDTYGHQTGDEVLCTAVERMQNAIRGIDVLGRWGGEEFAVLLPGATSDAASLVAERLRANVAGMRVPIPPALMKNAEQEIRSTVSVGVSTFRGGEDTLQQMLKRADTALYDAKAKGRNCVVSGPSSQHWATSPVPYQSRI